MPWTNDFRSEDAERTISGALFATRTERSAIMSPASDTAASSPPFVKASDSRFMLSVPTCTAFLNWPSMESLNCIPSADALFFIMLSLDSSVSYLWDASLANAVFSSQACVPISNALENTSDAPAARRSASRWRISVIPMSSRTPIALFPWLSQFESPLMKDIIAPAASF